MEIAFKDKKVRELCNDDRQATRELGKPSAKKLRARLDDLRAARCLEDMRSLPGRCHELRADLAGCFAMDLQGGLRLIFEVADDPVPRKGDSGIDWGRVTAVRIIEVRDYHG